MMFYLTSKFHNNRVNTFGFMEGGLLKRPPPPAGPGTPKKPRRNSVKVIREGNTVVTLICVYYNCITTIACSRCFSLTDVWLLRVDYGQYICERKDPTTSFIYRY